jgi:hypothetical protein
VDTTSIRTTTSEVTPNSRDERALKLFEERGHEIRRMGENLYRVPSCSGPGSYDVLYGGAREECPCPDFQFGCGRACKHLIALGIMYAARRSGVRVRQSFAHAAGDPFACAGKRSHACYDGWVYLGFEVEGENGEHVEQIERVPCRRCRAESL